MPGKGFGVAFGTHFTLDGYGCLRGILADQEALYDFLDEAPAQIGMPKIMPPFVMKHVPKDKRKDWGYSGVVLIAESHISFHTFTDKGYVSIDIFPYKPFDLQAAYRLLKFFFGFHSAETNIRDRGPEFPKIPVLVLSQMNERQTIKGKS